MTRTLGILLTNTGTPDSPSVEDVKRYLREFLSDPRVVRLPRLLWKPLLHTVILPSRAPYSAKLYQKIWMAEGSPLKYNMLTLTAALQAEMNQHFTHPVYVETGMHYGQPSIQDALKKLRAQKITDLVVLPLFPQYSTSTTETTRDQVDAHFKDDEGPQYSFISHYSGYPHYIEALVQQIRAHHSPQSHLLFSFHGLPRYFVDQGDPYAEQCEQTARLVAQSLDLGQDAWSLSYQSRLGYAKWLAPYTLETLAQLPARGIHDVTVVCPGFSVDCLETLEEIQIRGKEAFIGKGGKSFHYIPALNAGEAHVKALAEIVKEGIATSP